LPRLLSSAFAGASATLMASAAAAQPAPSPVAPAAGEAPTMLSEIVVTARRRSEALQNTPLMENVVTADSLQKLNLKQFQDIQAVVPGLSLAQNGSGYQAAASLRGVTFDVSTGAQPTVALYLNEAPVQALFLFQSLYDVGQIEVLRGPQGTARGVSAPSGAITVSSRRPDLAQFGGYADVNLTDLGGRAAQGAVNLPLIKDVLGLRVAGVIDQSDQDGVRSLHSALRPRQVTSSERVSLDFQPSDRFTANLTYQHLDKRLTDFDQVSGPGQGTVLNPALRPSQRVSVEDGPNEISQHFDVVTAQVDGRVLGGQHLSYVGSYLRFKIKTASSQDQGNLLPGAEPYARIGVAQEQTTQEIRLSSDKPLRGLLDYMIGAYYSWQNNGGHIVNTGPLLPGAFGDPAGPPDFAHFNPRYQAPVIIDVPSTLQETSIFANATFHLGHGTELSTGVRQIFSIAKSSSQISTGQIVAAVPLGFTGAASCAAAGLGSSFPGSCDLVIPGALQGAQPFRASETPHIYNLSLSKRVTPGLLLYANTGSSYRPPVASIGIQGALAITPDPELAALTFHPSEHTRAYEAGFKATFLNGRGRLNAALFRQHFENLTIFVPGVSYNNVPPGQTPAAAAGLPGVYVPMNFDFTASVDALVTGFDIDSAFQITRNWNVTAQMSYADGKVQGSKVPCNVTDAAGNPVFNTGGLISLCPGASSSRLPLWNASLQTEYVQQVNDKVDGFLRGLVTYYPQNRNRVEPDFTVAQYSLVNLYAGLRGRDGAWEVSLFARNSFDTNRTLDVQSVQLNANTQLGTAFSDLIHPTGYYLTQVTPRREVGINVHYAWGSR